jgi:roadblock/LC7 domain-containing protein
MSAAGVVFAGFLFVDDTDLIALAASQDEQAAQVVAHIQEAVRTWHGGL